MKINCKLLLSGVLAVSSLAICGATCSSLQPAWGCGGGSGSLPIPVICSYYPPKIDACYTAQTVGTITSCQENTSTNGTYADCVSAATEKQCRYDEYFANCCGNAQHAPQHRLELTPWNQPGGAKCGG